MSRRLEPIHSLDEPFDEQPVVDAHRSRVYVLQAIVILFVAVIVLQLWRLQILEGDYYRHQADNNRFRQSRIQAQRGVIYDRNRILLVRNRPSYSIGIVPVDLPAQPDDRLIHPTVRRLSKLIGVPAQEIREKVGAVTGLARFEKVPIKTNVDQELAFSVEARNIEIPGVHIYAEPTRDYLDGPLTAHLIGYVGLVTEEQYAELSDTSDLDVGLNARIGQTGVEATFDQELRGRPGERRLVVNAAGREVRELGIENPTAGRNLALTIDLDLQRAVRSILSEDIDRYELASAVALDPRNGQVLAMVHLPEYDNNMFSREVTESELQVLIQDSRRPLVNGAISNSYPPGSAFKVITAAAALQEGIVSSYQRIFCTGALNVPNRFDPTLTTRIADWAAHGEVDSISALAASCNVYFYMVGGGDPNGQISGLGIESLTRYARLFGLGEETGIRLTGEANGFVPSPEWKREVYDQEWYLGDTYLTAIGQGFVTVTPLQMASAVAVIANGGTLYRPQIVKQILDEHGEVIREISPEAIRQVPVAPPFIEVVRAGMRAGMLIGRTPYGTSYVGTSYTAEVPGLAIAGKTGTAEYGQPDSSGSLPTHGWFIAFAPAEEPEIALAVFVKRGRGAQDAGELAEAILRHYFRIPEELDD